MNRLSTSLASSKSQQSNTTEALLKSGNQQLRHSDIGIISRENSGNFLSTQTGFDLTTIPTHPGLHTGPRIQCCAKDGGSCSCPKCQEAKKQSEEEGGERDQTEQSTDDTQPEPSTVEASSPEQTPAESTPATPGEEPVAEPEAATSKEQASGSLIVEDSVTDLSEGQMKKTKFLQKLRSSICGTIGPVLATVGQTTEGCPYLNYWLDLYQEKDAAHIEQTARKYAPDVASAKNAEEYISIITQRALRAAEIWSKTGKITGVPDGVPTTLPDETENKAPANAVQAKAREGGVRRTDDPKAIQKELGDGQPLSPDLRSRMESAFDTNFSQVRTHTDSTASNLSNKVNARAFTIGNHVAFGNGEYQPGTLFGDALIAHELAHTLQQSGQEDSVNKMETGGGDYDALENDADKTAVSAITSIWKNGSARLGEIVENSMPRLRSGLRLQRCDGCGSGGCNTKSGPSKSAPSTTTAPGTPAAACKPTLTTLEAVKTGSAKMTTAWSGNCEMAYGEPTTIGTAFKSEVDVPAGCTGKLEYVQLIDRCLEKKQDGTGVPARPGVPAIPAIYKRRKTGGYVLDTSDPYLGINKIVTSPGSATLNTEDSPGSDAAGWDYMSITDKFKMWLLWTPNLPSGSPRVALAMVEWNWSGTATKTGAGDCATAWTLSGTAGNGGVGAATAAIPTWTKTYPGDFPYEPGRC